jgi:exonuclease III
LASQEGLRAKELVNYLFGWLVSKCLKVVVFNTNSVKVKVCYRLSPWLSTATAFDILKLLEMSCVIKFISRKAHNRQMYTSKHTFPL